MRHRPNPRSRNGRPTPGHGPETGLELCPACGTDFVNPMEWSAIEDHSWWMHLRCGQCDHTREPASSGDGGNRYLGPTKGSSTRSDALTTLLCA